MPIESISDLVEFLTRYPLLEPVQRDELDLLLKARFTDPRTLTRELLLREWLTPYQVNQVLQGHGTELMLGSYILQERLTEGELGQLFKARHLHMKRPVALQVVRPELLKDPRAVERFYSEIQAVSQLSHQHLVAAYDAGPIGDTHFFAMEYVEGIDLERHVQHGGPLAVDQACEFVRQAALGLQHAFERGMLHHDLCPANILVTRTGERATRNADEGSDLRHFQFRAGQSPQPRFDADPAAHQAHSATGRRLPGYATTAGLPGPGTATRQPTHRRALRTLQPGRHLLFLAHGPGAVSRRVGRAENSSPPNGTAQHPVEMLRPEVPPDVAALVAAPAGQGPERALCRAAGSGQRPQHGAASHRGFHCRTAYGNRKGDADGNPGRFVEQARPNCRAAVAAGLLLVALP